MTPETGQLCCDVLKILGALTLFVLLIYFLKEMGFPSGRRDDDVNQRTRLR